MIWLRSEMESTRRPSCSRILTRTLTMGISASGSAPAETTSRSRSGTDVTLLSCPAAEVGEEGFDPLPHLLAAAEPAPADADEADQFVAPIDRCDEVIARPVHSVHEESLDVRLELAEYRVVRHHRIPAVQCER